MSNKNAAVVERKIRPIYDYLDIGNPKRALQETEKLLKKQHDFLCAKALKVLALIRLGRVSEINDLLNEVEAADTDEEFTLQALTYCYRDLGKPDKIIVLYERALKTQPHNEEFLSHVMMAYARVGEHKKQSQFAMQLYKLKPGKSFYYFWSVMATVMQAYDDTGARSLYLSLADRMVEKCLKENKITAEAEIKLYCMILEMLDKNVDALNLLQSDLSNNLLRNVQEKRQKLIELSDKVGKYEETYQMCKTSLNDNLDDWFLWSHLMKSGLELIKANSETKRTIIDEITQLILKNVHLMDETSKFFRGPYLARLRFIVCLLEQELVVRSDLGEPSRLILDYFRRYGDRACCFEDIKSFLFLLGEQQHDEFIKQLEEICGGLNVTVQCDIRFAQNVTQMRRHLSALQLYRCLGGYRSATVEQKLALAKELVERYLAGLKFGSELLSTDMQYSDNYLLLAIYFLCEVYVEQAESSLLTEILLCLEIGLKNSPSNFQFKILLAKLYPLFGAGDCALEICESLQLKYIMHETFWYLLADQLSPWGFYSNIIQWASSSISFVNQSDREIMDNVIQCYKSGSFTRIIEFMEFRNKLKQSFHNSACKVWRSYFSLIVECSSLESLKYALTTTSCNDEISWATLYDNRDFRTLKQWEPEGHAEILAERCKESFEELIDQLRFYHLLTRLLSVFLEETPLPQQQSSAVAMATTTVTSEQKTSNGATTTTQQTPVAEATVNGASSGTDSISPENVAAALQSRIQAAEKFSSLFGQLKAHYKRCWNNYRNEIDQPLSIFGPPRGYFDLYLRNGYFDVLAVVFEVANSILKTFATNNNATTAKTQQRDESSKENESNGSNDNVEVAETKIPPLANEANDVVRFPTSNELQTILRVMFSHHQLQEGGCLFPHMQMCHISFVLQTMSVVLTTLIFLKTILDPASSNASSQQQKKSKKKKSAQKTNVVESEAVEHPLLSDFLKFSGVFCEAASTATRLISDLEMMLDTDEILLTLSQPKIVPEVLLEEMKPKFWAKLKSSYTKSLKSLNQLIAQHTSAVEFILRTSK